MGDNGFSWRFGGGHYPNQALLDGEQGTTIFGRNAWPLGNGTVQSWYGMLNTLVTGATSAMLVLRKSGGINGSGTVIGFREQSIIFVGSGTVIYDGAQIGVAINALQISKDGIVYLLGLTAPGAVVIADGGVAGRMTGYFSVKWTWFRQPTGEESNAGDDSQSNSLYLSSRKIAVPVPGAPGGSVGNSSTPATSNGGITAARLYSSWPGQSVEGPWFWTGIESSAFGTTLITDWTVGKLASIGKLAPYDHNPPPACDHSAVLAGLVLACGARGPGGGAGGGSIAPSLQATLGWDATKEVFLRPLEPITALRSEMAMDGYVVICGENSTHGILYAPNEIGPLIHRTISPNIGFPNSNALCVVGDGEIWGSASGDFGFVRSSAQGFDSLFSYPIQNEVKGLTNWVCGWDQIHDKVLYHSGAVGWAYDRRAPGDIWSNALDMPGTVQSCVTVGGVLHSVIGGQLYQFNKGSGGYSYAQVVPPFISGERGNKVILEGAIDAECPVYYRMLTNLSTSQISQPLATMQADPNTRLVSGSSPHSSNADQLWVPGKNFAPELRWTTPGGIVYGFDARGAGSEEWIGG